jgi:hypothetical protein
MVDRCVIKMGHDTIHVRIYITLIVNGCKCAMLKALILNEAKKKAWPAFARPAGQHSPLKNQNSCLRKHTSTPILQHVLNSSRINKSKKLIKSNTGIKRKFSERGGSGRKTKILFTLPF